MQKSQVSSTTAKSSSSSVTAVGEKLVEFCSRGENMKAIDSLYSEDIISIEATDMPGMPQELSGIDAIREKNKQWDAENEVSSCDVHGPFTNGDSFAVHFKMAGKNRKSGKSFSAEEVGLYTVRDGKIVKEEFFYTM